VLPPLPVRLLPPHRRRRAYAIHFQPWVSHSLVSGFVFFGSLLWDSGSESKRIDSMGGKKKKRRSCIWHGSRSRRKPPLSRQPQQGSCLCLRACRGRLVHFVSLEGLNGCSSWTIPVPSGSLSFRRGRRKSRFWTSFIGARASFGSLNSKLETLAFARFPFIFGELSGILLSFLMNHCSYAETLYA